DRLQRTAHLPRRRRPTVAPVIGHVRPLTRRWRGTRPPPTGQPSVAFWALSEIKPGFPLNSQHPTTNSQGERYRDNELLGSWGLGIGFAKSGVAAAWGQGVRSDRIAQQRASRSP